MNRTFKAALWGLAVAGLSGASALAANPFDGKWSIDVPAAAGCSGVRVIFTAQAGTFAGTSATTSASTTVKGTIRADGTGTILLGRSEIPGTLKFAGDRVELRYKSPNCGGDRVGSGGRSQ